MKKEKSYFKKEIKWMIDNYENHQNEIVNNVSQVEEIYENVEPDDNIYNILGTIRFFTPKLMNKIREKRGRNIYQLPDGTKFHVYMNKNDQLEEISRMISDYYHLKYYIGDRYGKWCRIRNLEIYYFPLEVNKYFPKKGETEFREEHVNTGCTFIDSGKIYLWRREEIEKVFIHELIHAWNFDRSIINQEDRWFNKYMKEETIVKREININESYTEWWAEIYYIMLENMQKREREIKRKKNRKSININEEIVKKVIESVKKQEIYSIIQTARILKWLGMTHWKELRKSNNKENNEFRQNTGVFSYYCMKSLLLHDRENYVKFIHTIQNNKIKIDWDQYGNEYLIYYRNILEDSINGGEYGKKVNKMIKLLDNKKNKSIHKIINHGGFRMVWL
jgi:hypothetical protein